jgi:hypothetical protein
MSTPSRALLVLSLLAAAARADVLHVPKDFPDIQSAVNAANQGDEIVIAAGTYEGVFLIEDKIDLHVRGQGQVKLTGSVADTPNLRVNSSSDIVLEHLRVQSSEGDGISITGCENVTVSHCRVEDSADDGISVSNGNHLALDHVIVTGSGGNGLLSTARGLRQPEPLHAGGERPERPAPRRRHRPRRRSHHGAGRGANGIVIEDGTLSTVDSVVLSHSLARDVGGVGILLDGSDLLVQDNRVIDSADMGLASSGANCVLQRNRIIGSLQAGISLGGGAHQCLHNRVVKPGLAGVVVSSGGKLLQGNRVLESLGQGISVAAAGDGCTLIDNRVTHPAGDGIEVNGDDLQALGNRVTGGLGRIRRLRTGGVYAGNKATGSTGFDLSDVTGNGNTYVDNHFGTTHLE